jgi:hypothetical protein
MSSRLAIVLLLAVTSLGVARTQPRLAAIVHRAKERDDVWLLPPPAELKAATLGYTAAATDLLWAKLLVEYGLHMSERRPFPDLNLYLDAILALEPDYGPLYRAVDTMLAYRPIHGTEQDARDARRYLERGLVERPLDYRVWLEYGQFIAFLAPSFLASDADKEQWRKDGADALMRAVELGADADRSIAAAAMMKRWGKSDAARRHLHQILALADDEQTREEIAKQLRILNASDEKDSAERALEGIEARWRREMGFVPRRQYLLLGPEVDPLSCAGPEKSGVPSCARAWDGALSEE